jgi:outer membrane protein TolC
MVLATLALAPPALGQGLSLEAALSGLPNAPDWRSADLTYENTVRQLESAYAAAGLQLKSGLDYSLGKNLDTGAAATQSLSLNATLSASVLPWSSANDQIRSAQRSLERAALDRRDSRSTLYINAVNAYWTARLAGLDHNLAQANERQAEAQLRVAQTQRQAGQITQEGLLAVQRSLENAQATRLQTALALENARLTLWNTLGIGPGPNDLITPTPEANLPTTAVERLVEQALERRSDVLKALSRLRDAEESLSNARRDRLLPEGSLRLGVGQAGQGNGWSLSAGLNLSGTASLTASYPFVQDQTAATPSTQLSLSASVSLPLIAPSADSRIASAETGLSLARQTYEIARKAAELDLRQRYSEAVTAKARVQIARTGLATATQALATAEARNKAGLNTALDLESARIAKLQSERDLEGALVNLHIAVLRLNNATGAELMGGVR